MSVLGRVSGEMGHILGKFGGPGKRNQGSQSMHQSLGLGEQASEHLGKQSKSKDVWEKEGGGGWAPEKEKGCKDCPGTLPSCQLWFP